MASSLPLIPAFLESTLKRWSDKRQPETLSQIKTSYRNLYILPTKNAITFFVVLLLILIGAINYENSLAYMLTFLLGSIGLLAMIYTHQNINHIQASTGKANPVFAGQTLYIPFNIKNTDTTPRKINLQLQTENGESNSIHLTGQQTSELQLPVNTKHRGYLKINRVKLFTEYPLGLFHAWSWIKPDIRCLVYPAPDSQHHPLFQHDNPNNDNLASDAMGLDDFVGIREYQIGDQPNHMAWKAIAKTGELQTKLFNTEISKDVWIDWSQIRGDFDIEQHLSILCRMVLDADDKSLRYGLNIPGIKILPSTGQQHKHNCLKALALFATDDAKKF